MEVKTNDVFGSNMREYALNLFTAGYGELDESWRGEVINSPFSRLYFILDGEFHITTNDNKQTVLKSPNVYLIPSGLGYHYGCEKEAKHLFFHLKLCTFDKIDVFGGLDKVICLTQRPDENNEELLKLALSQDLDDTFQIEQKIRYILSLILKENNLKLIKKEHSEEIQKAIKYITKKLSMKLGISEIAHEVHLAPSTLTKKFKQETKMSVGEYIDKQIMFKAERMLSSTNMSVSEISEALGFCDQFYFSRKFKEIYGISPNKHRKKINI